MTWEETRQQLARSVRQTAQTELRWSYLILGAFVLLGVAVNLLLAHGWTVWPVVLAAGLLVMINEAADRNGEGIPPLAVYGAFVGTILIWLMLLLAVSHIHPLILLLALTVTLYQVGRGWMKTRVRKQEMDARRAQGLCVFCGEPAAFEQTYCPHCGEVANPDGVRARWSTLSSRGADAVARTRAILKPPPPTTAARAKEQALLNRRHRAAAARRV